MIDMIDVRGLKVWRETTPADSRQVLDHVDLRVDAGERVALIGANGAGKTSLLLALVGAVPFEGSVTIAGQTLTRRSLTEVRRKLGYVFADPSDQFFLPTVAEELAYGPRQRGLAAAEVERRVTQALSQVRLQGMERRAVLRLSVGEQRRLALATVLTLQPDIILADEPTASLDPVARAEMLNILAGVQATVLLATHDLDAALELDARVVMLAQGRLVADGPARELLRDESLLHRAGLALPLRVAIERELARGNP